MVLKTSVEQPHSPGTECPSACFRMQIWMNFKKCNIDVYVIFQSWILVFSIIVDEKKGMAGTEVLNHACDKCLHV